MIVEISGSSDDLIDIYVNGKGFEEFGAYDLDEGARVVCGDGTVLSATYGDGGIWRFSLIHQGTAKLTKTEGNVDDDENDVVRLEGDIRWVALVKEPGSFTALPKVATS